MKERRLICTETYEGKPNCSYARVEEEHGEYPVLSFCAGRKDGHLDLSTMSNAKVRVDKTCYCVYCTHPSHSKKRFVGIVEPYVACYAPKNCPILREMLPKISFWKRIKSFFNH